MKPLTRKEIFQVAIARGEAPKGKPLTRSEIYMTQEAEREASGGGGVVKLYAGLGNPKYIYKDAECSQKISKDELNALIGEPVILIFNTSNGTTVSTVPTIGHTVDEYSFCEYATQGNFFMLYTEEYSDIN